MPAFLQQSGPSLIGPEVGLALWTAVVVVLLISFGLWAWSIVWAYHDAEKRGKSGVLVGLMIAFLSWPLGLVVWLVFRPAEARGNAPRSNAT